MAFHGWSVLLGKIVGLTRGTDIVCVDRAGSEKLEDVVGNNNHREGADNILDRRLERSSPLAGVPSKNEGEEKRSERPCAAGCHNADELSEKDGQPKCDVHAAGKERDRSQQNSHPDAEDARRPNLLEKPGDVRIGGDVTVRNGAGGESAGLKANVPGYGTGKRDEPHQELVAAASDQFAQSI